MQFISRNCFVYKTVTHVLSVNTPLMKIAVQGCKPPASHMFGDGGLRIQIKHESHKSMLCVKVNKVKLHSDDEACV